MKNKIIDIIDNEAVFIDVIGDENFDFDTSLK